MQEFSPTVRIFRPAPDILAFYDGRIEGMRLHSDRQNWLDDGAFALGVCSYAIMDGEDALVYDTHISLQHARIIRRTLHDAGIRRIRVILSHWHVDHVAGNEVFADCEIIAHRLTAQALALNRDKLEGDDPPIRPLIPPTQTHDGHLDLTIGRTMVQLRHADVHSLDGTVLLLPDRELMLAGDTLEDPITYVAEPDRLAAHLVGLDKLAGLAFKRILPNHGAIEVIKAGGYPRSLLHATKAYVEKLLRSRNDPALAQEDLKTFCYADFQAGAIGYFPAYEAVHRRNIEAVR